MKRLIIFIAGFALGVIVNKAMQYLRLVREVSTKRNKELQKLREFKEGYDKYISWAHTTVADTQPIKVRQW